MYFGYIFFDWFEELCSCKGDRIWVFWIYFCVFGNCNVGFLMDCDVVFFVGVIVFLNFMVLYY